jgi:competence protein ComEC
VLLLPFGYDALGWKIMGGGIELMLAIARWVAALPGAEGRVVAFGAAALLVATAGLLALTIPASRLRLAGIPLIGLALVLATSAPRPDVLVDPEGQVVAVRGADGQLSVVNARSNRIAAESWLAADADGRKARDDLARGFTCDKARCVARLYKGASVFLVRTEEAFADACREADLLVTRLAAPSHCAAPLIDRDVLATTGALALQRSAGRWTAEPARAPTAERPWYGRALRADPAALSRLSDRRSMPAEAKGAAPAANTDDVPTPDLDGEPPDAE